MGKGIGIEKGRGAGMTEQERKTMMNLADTIKGEINRMCVTKELAELDDMLMYAKRNIERLYAMKYADLKEGAQQADGFRRLFHRMIANEIAKAERETCGLQCLRCKQTYEYTWETINEISYTMYSYCPDCIRKGIQLLKAQDKEGAKE